MKVIGWCKWWNIIGLKFTIFNVFGFMIFSMFFFLFFFFFFGGGGCKILTGICLVSELKILKYVFSTSSWGISAYDFDILGRGGGILWLHSHLPITLILAYSTTPSPPPPPSSPPFLTSRGFTNLSVLTNLKL